MALRAPSWTRADLDRLPDDGNRYEVLDGELFVTPTPSAGHQSLIAWLSARIIPFVVTREIGMVHHPRSVLVHDGNQLEPDLMVLPGGAIASWDTAPVPILVVEALSKSTRRRDLNQKRDFYLRSGVSEYWVVDRFTRSVTRLTANAIEHHGDTLLWAPPGCSDSLEIDVAAMFRECIPEG